MAADILLFFSIHPFILPSLLKWSFSERCDRFQPFVCVVCCVLCCVVLCCVVLCRIVLCCVVCCVLCVVLCCVVLCCVVSYCVVCVCCVLCCVVLCCVVLCCVVSYCVVCCVLCVVLCCVVLCCVVLSGIYDENNSWISFREFCDLSSFLSFSIRVSKAFFLIGHTGRPGF